MKEKLRNARKVMIEDAAHLPNMDQLEKFRDVVNAFLDDLGRWVVAG